jgi:exodeoxyribonuclease VII large subunit
MARKKKTLFDPAAMKGPRPGPDVSSRPAGQSPSEVGLLGVSALVAQVKAALDRALPDRVLVAGQISNFKRHSSGHLYFSLKDPQAALDCVMFASQAKNLKFTPEDGLAVHAAGRIDVYESQGRLQLYVDRMSPQGTGALELAFRQLREKLQHEGLFEPARKNPIPRFPLVLGLVTSPTGAAVRDIQRTLRRRWPVAKVYLLGVRVQGASSPEEIASALARLDAAAPRLGLDVILLVRGGGSLEDLQAFNTEPVARALADCRTPVVTGVGHETDLTIADLVADLRAATPTAAAEQASPDARQLRDLLAATRRRFDRRLRERLVAARARLVGLLRSPTFRAPLHPVRQRMQRVDDLAGRLRAAMTDRLAAERKRLDAPRHRLARLHPPRLVDRAAARLDRQRHRLRWALGHRAKSANEDFVHAAARLAEVHPKHRVGLARQQLHALEKQLRSVDHRRVLKRGFSLTRTADGKLLRSVKTTRPGQRVETELHDGSIYSDIVDCTGLSPDETRQLNRKRKPRKQPPDPGPDLFG